MIRVILLFCISLVPYLSYGQSVPVSEALNGKQTDQKLASDYIRFLDTIYADDQFPRLKLDSVRKKDGVNSAEYRRVLKLMNFNDSVNLIKIVKFIDQHGWLGPSTIGQKGATTLFLVIQHSDLATQQKYLPLMREAVKNGHALPRSLALLEDRIALKIGNKQIYGSQVYIDPTGKPYFAPIEDEINVNKRRAEVGLEPLQDYAKRFGFEYIGIN